MADITLWKPEPDVILHQALGKLNEEAGELQQIVARCLIQGIDAADPKTGRPNSERLEEEIADVFAAARWLRTVGPLRAVPPDRETTKLQGFRQWERMLVADMAISAGTIRDGVIDLIENRTGISREDLVEKSDQPIAQLSAEEEPWLDVVTDIFERFRVALTVDLFVEAPSLDAIIETTEAFYRRLAECN